MEQTNRQKAITWFNASPYDRQYTLAKQWYGTLALNTLTGREIELIWQKEAPEQATPVAADPTEYAKRFAKKDTYTPKQATPVAEGLGEEWITDKEIHYKAQNYEIQFPDSTVYIAYRRGFHHGLQEAKQHFEQQVTALQADKAQITRNYDFAANWTRRLSEEKKQLLERVSELNEENESLRAENKQLENKIFELTRSHGH